MSPSSEVPWAMVTITGEQINAELRARAEKAEVENKQLREAQRTGVYLWDGDSGELLASREYLERLQAEVERLRAELTARVGELEALRRGQQMSHRDPDGNST